MTNPVIIGNASLYLARCEEVLPTLPKSALLLTDPPYGVKQTRARILSRGKPSSLCPRGAVTDYGNVDWTSDKPSVDQIMACVAAANEAIVWGGNYFGMPSATKWLVWDKDTNGDFADGELAWTNLKGAVRIFKHTWSGFRRQSEFGVKRVHPTQKPVALMTWCIERAKHPKTIIDPFMGSGTTGIAAIKSGASFIGIGCDPTYFESACCRIEEAVRACELG